MREGRGAGTSLTEARGWGPKCVLSSRRWSGSCVRNWPPVCESACARPAALDQGRVTRAVLLVPLPPPPVVVYAENSSSDQRQACKKHELYVSFRDLGWQVRRGLRPPGCWGLWGGLPPSAVGLCPECAVSCFPSVSVETCVRCPRWGQGSRSRLGMPPEAPAQDSG